MTLTMRVLVGLVLGFAIGLALSGNPSPAPAAVIAVLTPVGTIFVNLIRMTVVPLVVALLIASLGSTAASAGLGRIGSRALGIALILLTTAALGSVVATQSLLAYLPIDQSAALALQGPATPTTAGPAAVQAAPTVASWFVDLVPANVIKAAADGSMLPLIVFSVMFGLTLAHLDPVRRDPVLRVVEGVADTMQRLVTAVLALAPIGVFALAVPLATRLGWSAAGAVAIYVALVVALTVVAVAVLLYPLGILAGPLSAAAFLSYCAPSQAIAFASRSSLAALPAMVRSAEQAGLPSSATGVVLPLAAAVYHFGAAVAQTVGVLFLAHLYNVPLSPFQLASVTVAVVLASFAVPGIPGGSIIAMVPAMTVANLPLEGMGILLAVDTIPDMFRTTANVTGSMVLTAILPQPTAQ
ncbi:MAG TPA: dicarboxylate/amino acid:cation symporter [Vicinamibacterales bacterium]|nr:dicarboxylate/amino acid:cation symporter [Vicinamibacterales bacterium]